MEDIASILADDAKLTEVTKAVFEVVDKDGSGQIDRKELKAALVDVAREAGIESPTDAQIDEAIIKLDVDNSGTIDLNEFKELIRQLLIAFSS